MIHSVYSQNQLDLKQRREKERNLRKKENVENVLVSISDLVVK